jgi:hypothetical protein
MIALVDPPIALSNVIALSSDSGVRIVRGDSSSVAISTARRPVASAIAARELLTAGTMLDPISENPSASVSAAIVDALPISLQWPCVGISWRSSSRNSRSDIRPERTSSV